MCALIREHRGESLKLIQGGDCEANQPLAINCLTDLAASAAIRQEWDELISACPDASIFSTWEWLSSWWKAFGAERQLLVLTFRDATGRLAALAPLAQVERSVGPGLKLRFLEFMGDGSNDSDNLGMLVRPEFESSFARSLIASLPTLPRWDVCQLRTMDPDSRAAQALTGAVHANHWPAFSSFRPWTLIYLPATWELYRKLLSSKERGKLGTRTRRLEGRYQTVYHRCASIDELPNRLQSLYELHSKRWAVKELRGSFVSAERRRMYSDLARNFLERGWLEFWFLELDGRSVATLFNFRFRDTVYSLQEGYDPEYSADSVGYVLRGHVLKKVIEEGVRRYDFLQGKDPSKERWGAQVQNYLDFEFARPWTKGSAYLNMIHGVGRLKQSVRAHASDRTWAFLHELNVRLRGKRRKDTNDD